MTSNSYGAPHTRENGKIIIVDKEGLRSAVRKYAKDNGIAIGDVYTVCGRYKTVEQQIYEGRLAPSVASKLKEIGINVDEYVRPIDDRAMFNVFGTEWIGTKKSSPGRKPVSSCDVALRIHRGGTKNKEERKSFVVYFYNSVGNKITTGNKLAWGIASTTDGEYMVFSDQNERTLTITKQNKHWVIKKTIDSSDAVRLSKYVGDYKLMCHPVLGWCVKLNDHDPVETLGLL